MGKNHNVLYVAAKLCFDWQLQDTLTVALLLNNIFSCEKTFERLLLGAIFGTRAPYFLAGWKSDFADQEENVRAMVFFICHANRAQLQYKIEGESTKFIDVPIESCGKTPAIKIILQLGNPETLLLLLRFGAVVSEDAESSGLDNLLEKLKEYKGVYPFHLVACLKFIVRVVIRVRVSPVGVPIVGSNIERDAFNQRFPRFVKDGLVAPSRCGECPPELKHLCRCAIRYRLWQQFQLPNGIRKLPLPDKLHRYLDLLTD